MTLTQTVEIPERPSFHNQRFAKQIIVSSGLVVLVLLFSPIAGGLRILFPVISILVGVVLLWAWPSGFVAFTFWLWMLSPLVRRAVDFRAGYVDPSPILLSPLLVTCLVVPRSLSTLNVYWRTQALPFFLMVTALTLGLISGLFHNWGPQEILKDAASWGLPCLWGCFVAFDNNTSDMAKVIAKQCVWAVLLLGFYGIYQYIALPGWDAYWLDSILRASDAFSELNAFGVPEPFKIRVWSTLNAPGTFSMVLACCLLIVLAKGSKLRIPAFLVGVFSLLLSEVRISWIGLAVGLMILCFAGVEYRKIVFLSSVIGVALITPIVAVPSFHDPILSRLQTFSELSNDGSLNKRAEMHGVLLAYIATHPLGVGFGHPRDFDGLALDSGIITIPYIFGWTGAILIGVAFGHVVLRFFATKVTDKVTLGFKLALICIIVHLPAGAFTVGAPGFFLWTSAAFVLAIPETQLDESIRMP